MTHGYSEMAIWKVLVNCSNYKIQYKLLALCVWTFVSIFISSSHIFLSHFHPVILQSHKFYHLWFFFFFCNHSFTLSKCSTFSAFPSSLTAQDQTIWKTAQGVVILSCWYCILLSMWNFCSIMDYTLTLIMYAL